MPCALAMLRPRQVQRAEAHRKVLAGRDDIVLLRFDQQAIRCLLHRRVPRLPRSAVAGEDRRVLDLSVLQAGDDQPQ
jgi:hypothetical protein